MNLLGAILYDPSSAASKATSSLLAMTALDTTNLRLTVTVPSHGIVMFRAMGQIVGATTCPTILIGVLNGATVVARVTPSFAPVTANVATQAFQFTAEFIATGLAAGSTSFDLAYAVQVIVASTNIKYGGPNNASGANAWGAIVFEAWDPQPLTTGLAGGVNVKQWNGTNVSAPATAGIPDVNVKNIVNVAATLDANNALNVSTKYVGGTLQTAGDIYSKVSGLTFTVAGKVDANTLAVGGTTQTARDLGASVLLSSGTGTGQISLAAGLVTVGTNNDKSGYSLTQSFPANFSALGISVGGHVSNVDTLTTYTGDTPQTGDAFARIGAPAGASIAADLAEIEAETDGIAAIPTTTPLTAAQIATGIWQDATAGDFTAASSIGKSVLNGVALGTGLTINAYTGNTVQTGDSFARIGAAGAGLTALGDTRIAHLDADVSSRLAPAGTLATVTNLTNAPGAGDFTAAMKTSLNAATPASVTGAVGSVTGAVGSVTGNLGGNVVGSVASVTAAVTVGTNNDKTGYALSASGLSAIWTTQLSESYAAKGTVPTLAQILFESRALQAEKSVGSTTLTTNKIDGVTAAATYTLNDATSPTAITRAT